MPDTETIRVESPTKGFTGTRYGVHFKDGVGQATYEQARFLHRRGYHVTMLEEHATNDAAHTLVDVKGIGPARLEELKEAGVETAGDLRAASPNELSEALGVRPIVILEWQIQLL